MHPSRRWSAELCSRRNGEVDTTGVGAVVRRVLGARYGCRVSEVPYHPRVLVVCTANICRSPMMEGLLRRDLGILGASVEVISAGLLDWDQAVDPQAAAVMAERGVDIAGHRSRPISTIDLHTLDLVITMTREHAREVVLGLPEVYRRTFTVKDFARRIDAEPAGEPGEDLRTRMSALSSGRALSSLMGISEEDDVADPYGLTPMHFEATADLLSVLSERISLALLTLTR